MIDREEAYAKKEVRIDAVGYACLHWVFHLQGAKADGPDGYKSSLSFLKQHFLHWLEALSEMHQVPESIKMLKSLQTLSQVRDYHYNWRHAISALQALDTHMRNCADE